MNRNKSLKFSTEIELGLEIHIECSLTPFIAGSGHESPYGPSQDEPSEVEDLSVRLKVGLESVEISHVLPREVIELIERVCLEQVENES